MDQIFVSSVQKDLPPADRRVDEVFLDEVRKSAIHVGIFGNQYGRVDEEDLSPTEREFIEASRLRKRRVILVKGRTDKNRQLKMQALLQRAGDDVARRRFEDTAEMLRLLYGSLIQYLQDRGFVAARDFDAVPCEGATMRDISVREVRWFIEKARAERSYALAPDTPRREALAHLYLLGNGKPTNGAVLLSSEAPERFVRSAEVNCLHFHGTDIVKPIPSQHVYRGSPQLCIQVRCAGNGLRRSYRGLVPGRTSRRPNSRHDPALHTKGLTGAAFPQRGRTVRDSFVA